MNCLGRKNEKSPETTAESRGFAFWSLRTLGLQPASGPATRRAKKVPEPGGAKSVHKSHCEQPLDRLQDRAAEIFLGRGHSSRQRGFARARLSCSSRQAGNDRRRGWGGQSAQRWRSRRLPFQTELPRILL